MYKFSTPLPTNYIIMGIVAIVFAISFLITSNYISSGILFLVGGAFVTARTGYEVSIGNKTIRDFNSIFWIKWGSAEPYRKLEKLSIKSGLYSQTMSSRGSSSTFKFRIYTLCILIDGAVYELKKSKKYERLEALMNELGEEMGIPVEG